MGVIILINVDLKQKNSYTLAAPLLFAGELRVISSYAKVGKIAASTPDDNGKMMAPPSAMNLWSHANAVSLINGSVEFISC